MERYYVPAQFTLTNDSLFSVRWVDNNYYVFNGCPDRTNPVSLDFIKVSPWGYTLDIGNTNIPIDSQLLVGENCDSSQYDIFTVSASRSLLDVPELFPFEPFYFLGFLALSIWIILFSFKLIFGKGYR